MNANHRYYRWVVLRSAPLFLFVFGTALTAALLAVQFVPARFAPVATLILTENGVGNSARDGTVFLQNVQTRLLAHKRLIEIVDGLQTDMEVEQFRDALTVSTVSGRDRPTLMTVSVLAQDADFATRATNEIANQVLLEFQSLKEEQVQHALTFFRDEVEQSAGQLQTAQNALQAFIADHAGVLPGDRARHLDQRRELVVALAKEPKPDLKATLVKQMRAELEEVRAIYSDQHPTVRALEAKISQTTPDRTTAVKDLVQDALAQLDAKLTQIPINELALRALQREFDWAETQYRAALERLEDAEVTQRILQRSEGGSLQIVELAHLPEQANDSRKRLMVAGSAVIAFLLGLGVVAARLHGDRKVRRPKDLETHMGLTPYAVIPLMRSA